ncbi:hypothetical protein EYF80_059522 [Liparis tanakae]|uniref:Uncharacterized protein n=1 Tax=Liparis tanakae TaxID=230148 RepID=A0A4Z2EPK0_9TELE|nr:hypothetical protein EYF80_059522 [Liparis tanakae]
MSSVCQAKVVFHMPKYRYGVLTPSITMPHSCSTMSSSVFSSGGSPVETSLWWTHFLLLAILRYSLTVMDFFWMLYWVNSPDWPVTTCMMGAGMTMSSMVS